jgi:hypothetical protein
MFYSSNARARNNASATAQAITLPTLETMLPSRVWLPNRDQMSCMTYIGRIAVLQRPDYTFPDTVSCTCILCEQECISAFGQNPARQCLPCRFHVLAAHTQCRLCGRHFDACPPTEQARPRPYGRWPSVSGIWAPATVTGAAAAFIGLATKLRCRWLLRV